MDKYHPRQDCPQCGKSFSIQNLQRHIDIKHAGKPREQDKESKVSMLKELGEDAIRAVYMTTGSIEGVLKHHNLIPDSSCRKYIRSVTTGLKSSRGKAIRSTDLEARKDEILALLPSCPTRISLLQALGITRVHEGMYKTLNAFLTKHNLVITERTSKWTNDQVYVENSRFSRNGLAVRVKRDGWMPYTCQACSNPGEWQGTSLTLHLDHISGNNTDHRKENLRWLCPNCHSQTPTYCKGWKQKKA